MAIRFESDGNVAVVTIEREEALNAIDREHDEALAAAFERYEADPALLACILTGAGTRAFSAGADLKELIPHLAAAARAGQEPPSRGGTALGGITGDRPDAKPIVAAINGFALAGGLELALACDVRLASPNAVLGLTETRWALIPGAGGTQRLARSVPLGVALEMILTGEPIDAETALRVGLVNRIVPAGELLDEALRVARIIASRGPLAVRAARSAVLAGLGKGLHEGLAIERQHFLDILRSEDAAEGPRAFTERRPPRFVGR